MKPLWLACGIFVISSYNCCPQRAAVAAEFVALPEQANTIGVLKGNETYLEFLFSGWGPNWQWLGFGGEVAEAETESRLSSAARVAASGANLRFDVVARSGGPSRLAMDIQLQTDKDTDVTYLITSVELPAKIFAKGKVLVEAEGDTRRELNLPLGKQGLGERVKKFTLIDGAGRRTTITLDPPCDVASDGAVRIVLAEKRFSAGTPRRVSLTVDLPGELTYFTGPKNIPDDTDLDQWYVFQPSDDHAAPSEIGMADWLDAPAGRHGRITRTDGDLIYNGRPIKLWGLNVCFGACAPDKELAERQAALYAKYGVNSVRLHKYADGSGWAGIQSADSFTRLDPDGLDRMDYFIAQLKQRGIYVKLSAHFGSQKLGPADRQFVPYLEEFGSFDGRKNRITTPHSAIHYAPELQDVQIRQMVNLLKHRNPYTGQTYADDPAVAFIEIINEQSILFFTSMAPLKTSPTLRKHVAERFCEWLRAKYETHEKLAAAWGGEQAFDGFQGDGFPAVGEHLDKKNILPLGNPWYWDPAQLSGSQAYRARRLMDTMRFLYELQNQFYDRYVGAVREAGYEGEILSSNWQAGRGFSHYYNLHSDYRVGTIDRHNYFGGGGGGKIDNVTMLRVPGSGMLSAGMQQVVDRPFMLSEWIHVAPNEWGVEGPAIIGAYGMGLQGWDVSYMFQNRDNGTFRNEVGRDRWEVTTPQVLGVFPAVARQVLRGDVAESDVLAVRNVHVPSLDEGELDFDDTVAQEYDAKTFDSDKVPARTLAVARSVVAFTDKFRPTPAFDISRYREGNTLVSTTEQLRWREGMTKLDGFFTINTDATKAVVGFADWQRCKLGQVTIAPRCRFGAIYVTAMERGKTIETSNKLLVVAIARARNTGMKVYNDCRLIDRGGPPVRMEPVKATIALAGRGAARVTLLDHAGRRAETTLPVTGGEFTIDGARDKTPYYLVEFD